MPSPQYTADLSRETLAEIRKAEAEVSRCIAAEEMAKENSKLRKSETKLALERLRALSRGERGMFDGDGDEESE